MRTQRNKAGGVGRKCEVDVEVLRETPLFRGLGDRELEWLASTASCKIYRRCEEIAKPTEDEGHIFVFGGGLARLVHRTREDEETVLAVLWKGDVCGLVFIEPVAEPESLLQALVDETMVYRIAWRRVEELAAAHPEVLRKAFELARSRLGEAYEWMKVRRSEKVEVRVRHALRLLVGLSGKRSVGMTHQELAMMVGASREEVTRCLPNLRDEGLIVSDTHRHGIIVPDPDRL